jgi:tRNA pseudouridine32 synthase/23S rRNA pseudouridine746 synthase
MFSACRRRADSTRRCSATGRSPKHYEAIAPALPTLELPHLRETRLTAGTPFFRMREVHGVPNARTRIEVLESDSATHIGDID